MTVTRYTLTGDVSDLSGALIDVARQPVVVLIHSNSGAVSDQAGNVVQVGVVAPEITSGAFTAELIATNSDDINPADGLQYRVTIHHPRLSGRVDRLGNPKYERVHWHSGWFELTANTELADVVVSPLTEPAWRTEFMDQAQALLDAQIVISGIDDSDSAVAGLIEDALVGPLTTAALSTAIAAQTLDVYVPAAVVHAGAVDDAVTVNAAIAALPAGGGVVYLAPSTSWTFATSVTILAGVVILGAGAGATSITYTGTSYAFSVGAVGNWKIRELTVVSSTGGGILIAGGGGAINNAVEHVRFFCTNATKGGLDMTGNVNELVVNKCLFQTMGAGGGINAASGANNVHVTASIFGAANGSAIGINAAVGCDNWLIDGGCNFEGSATGLIGIVCGGTSSFVIQGNYFEEWTGAAITANNATGAKSLSIIGNSIQAKSSAAAACILNSAGPNVGVDVRGNHFITLGNANMTTVGVLPGATKNFTASGNTSGGSGTDIVSYNAHTVYALAGAGTSPPAPTTTTTGPASGTVLWGTGTATATGNQVQLVYGSSYVTTSPPPAVSLTPLNAATAALQPYVNVSAFNAINIAFAVAPAASQPAGTYALSFNTSGS